MRTSDRDEAETAQEGQKRISGKDLAALTGASGSEVKIEFPEYIALGFDIGVIGFSETRVTAELPT